MDWSISRQALTFKRRHTQHSGSSPLPELSAPHTEHFSTFFNRSVEIERFACSRISAATTGSGFGSGFRRIAYPSQLSLWQKPTLHTTQPIVNPVLRRFAYLHNDSDVQGSTTARAPLSGQDPRRFPFQVQIRWNSVRADRTEDPALDVVLDECLHTLTSLHRTQIRPPRLYGIRKDS